MGRARTILHSAKRSVDGGDGIFGITFQVQGSMQQPQVIVNPLSLVTPGIFRTLMEMTGDQRITPREEAKPQGAPQVRSAGPQASDKAGAATSATPATAPRAVKPEVGGGWSSQSAPQPPRK